jgi:hypothetical protein
MSGRFVYWYAIAATMVVVYVLLHILFEHHAGFQVQAVWTMTGIAGMIITGTNLIDAFRDHRALRASGKNGDLAYMAKTNVRVEALRFWKMITIVGVGLLALQSTPVLTNEQRAALHIPTWTFTGVLITGGLVFIVVSTVIQAALDRVVRNRFYGRRRSHE